MSRRRQRRTIWLFDRNGYPVRCRRGPSEYGRCHYCGVSMNRDDPERFPTLDHKLPRCRGGSNQKANLVHACYACNQRKGRMTAEEFTSNKFCGAKLSQRPGNKQHI